MAKFAFLVVLAKVLAKVLAEQDCHSPGACQDEGSALLQLNHGGLDWRETKQQNTFNVTVCLYCRPFASKVSVVHPGCFTNFVSPV